MKRSVIALLTLWTLAGRPAFGAADDPSKVPAPARKTPKEQVQEVLDAYEKALLVYRQANTRARTDEERTKARQIRPRLDEYAARFLAIADAAPDDPAAVDALVFHVALSEGDTSKAIRRLAEKHAADPGVIHILPKLGRSNSPAAETLLRAVAEKNRDRTARGMAMIALARSLKRRLSGIDGPREDSQRPRGIEGIPTSREGPDRAAADRMRSTDPTALGKEIEAIVERIRKEYGDVRYGRSTLGEQAANLLGEIRDLAIGKPCPEIAGEDIDGKPFKLSDYKGKVVVIDFWGDW